MTSNGFRDRLETPYLQTLYLVFASEFASAKLEPCSSLSWLHCASFLRLFVSSSKVAERPCDTSEVSPRPVPRRSKQPIADQPPGLPSNGSCTLVTVAVKARVRCWGVGLERFWSDRAYGRRHNRKATLPLAGRWMIRDRKEHCDEAVETRARM